MKRPVSTSILFLACFAICSMSMCPYTVPIQNGTFDLLTLYWEQEVGTGVDIADCYENSKSVKTYGCDGVYGLLPLGTSKTAVVSQTVSISDQAEFIDGGSGILYASVNWLPQ